MVKSTFPRFPRAFMSASREELTSAKLTIKYGQGYKGARSPDGPKLPGNLQGHVFIISMAGTVAAAKPQPETDHDVPEATVIPGADGKTALFDGDGMVYRLDFSHACDQSSELEQAQLTCRLLKTPAFFADQITHQTPEYKDFRFFDFGIARISLLGICNQINTAFVPLEFNHHPHRLLATSDANRPYEIDPYSLKIVGPIGNLDNPEKQETSVWKTPYFLPGIFELLIGSAHPCADMSAGTDHDTGEVFMVNTIKNLMHLIVHESSDPVLAKDTLHLIRWSISPSETEKIEKWKLIHQGKPVQILQSTHMLGMTQNYIIIADTALKLEQKDTIFLLALNLVQSMLDVLTMEGDERQQKIQELEQGFRFAWQLSQLSSNKLRRLLLDYLRHIKSQLFQTSEIQLPTVFLEQPQSTDTEAPITAKPPDEQIKVAFEILEQGLAHPSFLSAAEALSSEAIFDVNMNRRSSRSTSDTVRSELVDSDFNPFLSFIHSLQDANPLFRHPAFLEKLKQLRLEIASPQNPNTPLYIVKRIDLDGSQAITPNAVTSPEINVKRVEVEGAIAHFLTDFSETEEHEICLLAIMNNAVDPSEYITDLDQSKILTSQDIRDLSGAIPASMDSNAIALLKINPQSSEAHQGLWKPWYELSFDKIQADDRFTTKQIYPKVREDPLFWGLYAYRNDTARITDFYVLQGGVWPELLTDFIYELYKDYSEDRRMPVDQLCARVARGIPNILVHIQVDREQSDTPLRVKQTYEFDPELLIFSLQFVPCAGSHPDQGDEGYIICTVVHSDKLYSHTSESPVHDWSDNSEIWIFDAKSLADGPLYKMSHPHLNWGMTVHSTWLEKIAPVSSSSYSFKQDYQSRVEQFIKDYQKIGGRNNQATHRHTIQSLLQDIDEAFERYRQGP